MLMLRSDASVLVGVTDPTSSVVADGVLAVGRRTSSAHWEHRKLLTRDAKQPMGGGGRGSWRVHTCKAHLLGVSVGSAP